MASAVASSLPCASVSVSYGWLSPRVSFSRDASADEPALPSIAAAVATPAPAISKDFIDFEFNLGGFATMLPADELFADGKLLPLRKPPAPAPDAAAVAAPQPKAEALSTPPEPMKHLHAATADSTDPYVFSPKAPSCSSRWRELLGLKKAGQTQSPKPSLQSTATAKTHGRTSHLAAARSLKLLLQRNNGRASGAAASDLAAPLLRDSSDSEGSLSLSSSRFSLSSSSSGHDHDDLPRLSLDSADPNPPRIRLVRSGQPQHHAASSRTGRSPARRRTSPPRCLSVDSPRMNSSGKVVFQGLGRSSSSPSSFHAGPKPRSRAVDRSYSGVRVAPVVLNVPMCSRPVFGFFKEKRDLTAREAATARSRPAMPRKSLQGWSGELPRSST